MRKSPCVHTALKRLFRPRTAPGLDGGSRPRQTSMPTPQFQAGCWWVALVGLGAGAASPLPTSPSASALSLNIPYGITAVIPGNAATDRQPCWITGLVNDQSNL